MAMRGARLPLGSAKWLSEERKSAVQMAEQEVDEFSFSARNDFDWLNEHMAAIFDENEINVVGIFKTPGKMLGKTPRATYKQDPVAAPSNSAAVSGTENRLPPSDIFTSTTPTSAPNRFTQQLNHRAHSPSIPMNDPIELTPKRAASPRPPLSPAIAAAIARIGSPNPVQGTKSSRYDARVQSHYDGNHVPKSPNSRVPASGQLERSMGSPVTRSHQSPERPTSLVKDAAENENIPQPSSRAASPTQLISGPRFGRPGSPIFNTTGGAPASPRPLPIPSSPAKPSPTKTFSGDTASIAQKLHDAALAEAQDHDGDVNMEQGDEGDQYDQDDDDENAHSPSPSPARHVMRKSSLNFASLPAREPLAHKSTGARISRTSNLDMLRNSYYPRTTPGKSLGATFYREEEEDEMDVDGENQDKQGANDAPSHNMTYTQRLQDQINKLVESQPKAARPSKSIHNLAAAQSQQHSSSSQPATRTTAPSTTPRKSNPAPVSTTPGAFPGADADDDDDWGGRPATHDDVFSPSAATSTTEMKSVAGEFLVPKHNDVDGSFGSPLRSGPPDRAMSTTPSHSKNSSIPTASDANPAVAHAKTQGLNKAGSVSGSSMSSTNDPMAPSSPLKSPARSLRESPLKQVKNKLSSILKSSKGLLASSAAASAEGKSLMSPSRVMTNAMQSTDSLNISAAQSSNENQYSDLSARANEAHATGSPRPARRTRASAERERLEKQQQRDTKFMVEQISKLDRVREEEREKARLFSQEKEKEQGRRREEEKERERLREIEILKEKADEREREREREAELQRKQELKMQRQLELEKEREREHELELERERERELEREKEKQRRQPRPLPPKPTTASNSDSERPKSRTALTSPRKIMRPRQVTTQQLDDDEMEVSQTPARSTASTARPPTSHSIRTKEIKRPTKPVAAKMRLEPPKHIVVKPTSLYHPSTAALSANLQDTLDIASVSQPQVTLKSSQSSLKEKDSTQSLKSSVVSSASTTRSRTVDLAAKKKEQEEQRRKESKAEAERRRAAHQEETHRFEQQREEDRKVLEAKKKAQRQAALERAKQTRAPPPAVRNQPNGPHDYSQTQKSSRPASRIAAAHPAEIPRPKSAMKVTLAAKRQLEEEKNTYGSRSGATYQGQDSKRRRTGEDFGDDETDAPPAIKGPPVRLSSAIKRDLPTKSMYGSGAPSAYGQASQAAPGPARDLFKTNPAKPGPHDMSQFSKGAIPFASNNANGSNNTNPPTNVFKTPGRTALPSNAKSVAKSVSRPSPRFQNGENIELPEIDTDEDEDEDDEEENARNMGVAPWADSPDLRQALIRQETMDPSLIFGPPVPLNMEEVFSKNKDRWNKFRARTSSANWTGADRLTEEDIRKDLAARDRIRRDGGWSYDLSRELS
ncbi:hypothetical protein BROUX41_001530 [Berkeleyomyces rouxiae]